MKNIYVAMLLLGMVILSLGSVSALELNPFAEKKIYEPTLTSDVSDFIKQDFNEKYGTIKLSKTFFWIETDKIAEYSLVENTEQCLINCEARGKAVLYSPGKLFDDLNFIDKKGMNLDINAKYLIKTIETYEVEVPDTYKEVCEKAVSNETKDLLLKEESSCYQVVDTYKNETKENEVWVEYKGEELKAGEYEWKIQGTKNPTKAIDFIPTARGKTLNEWAWWDSDWKFKREIKVKENSGSALSNYSTLIYIPYDSDMQADFDDLIFTNDVEDTELGYWIENKNDGVNATIWVKVPELTASQNTSIYMYYGNSGASSESNKDNVFIKDSWDFTSTAGSTSGNPNLGFSLYMGGSYVVERLDTYWEVNGANAYLRQHNVDTNTYQTITVSNKWANFTYQLQPNTPYHLVSATEYNYRYKDIGDGSTRLNSVLSTTQFGSYGADGWLFNIDNVYLNLNPYASSEPTYYILDEQLCGGVAIDYVTPPTLENYANITQDYIPIKVNVTFTSSSFINITYSLRDINGTNYTQFYENETYDINFTDIPDAHYHYDVEVCAEGESLAIICETTETRHINHDTTPPTLTLNEEITNQTTLTLPINVTLNFTAEDELLDKCWYEYNETNTTFTCNTTQTINVTTSGAHSINYFANDTLGNLASNSTSFYIYYITRNATATNPITEGGVSSHSFYLNMTDITNFNATAELYWNGTSYGLGTKTTLSNDSLRFDKNIIVPSINGTSVNWTWVYNISGNPNVTNYNISGNQTYIRINITECGAGTYQILNYTLYDQETRALGSTANASIEVDLTLTSQANDSLSWQYHATKTNSTSFFICLPSGALNNSAYNLDSVSKYTYQDHVIQYHYIENFNLTNSSIPQTIRLYPLATAKSTSFLVNYQDENYIYVENAVIDVWRRYIGDGVLFSVEHGKTDANGQTRLHLVTEDIVYKFLVWQDGELVYTSPEFLALCQATPCQINLRQSTEDTNGFSERDNLIYDYDFNKTTRTASFTFATKDNTQTEINMTILSSNQYANDTACTTSLTTSGGQIDCVIPTAFTNTSYQTIIYQDGQYFGTAFDSLAPSSMEIFGYTGLILTAISYLMLALMGISSGIATIIFGIIGLVFMGIIQIFESGNVFGMASAILWLIVAGVIIIIKITKRRIQ